MLAGQLIWDVAYSCLTQIHKRPLIIDEKISNFGFSGAGVGCLLAAILFKAAVRYNYGIRSVTRQVSLDRVEYRSAARF